MQRLDFEKHWNHYKNHIQNHWNRLTSEDLYKIDGMYDHFVKRLMERYGYSWEMAEKEIEKWQPPAIRSSGEWKREKRKIHEFKPESKGSSGPEWKQKKRKAG